MKRLADAASPRVCRQDPERDEAHAQGEEAVAVRAELVDQVDRQPGGEERRDRLAEQPEERAGDDRFVSAGHYLRNVPMKCVSSSRSALRPAASVRGARRDPAAQRRGERGAPQVHVIASEQRGDAALSHADGVVVAGRGDEEVVPEHDAAGAQHAVDLPGRRDLDVLVEDGREHHALEDDVKGRVRPRQARRIALADVGVRKLARGVGGLVGDEVDACHARPARAPELEAQQPAAAAAAHVEQVAVAQRQHARAVQRRDAQALELLSGEQVLRRRVGVQIPGDVARPAGVLGLDPVGLIHSRHRNPRPSGDRLGGAGGGRGRSSAAGGGAPVAPATHAPRGATPRP